MTATMLQPEDIARANRLAMMIGATFQRERKRRHERLLDVARRLGMSPRSSDNIIKFEQGAVTGVRLDTIVRYLGLYGLTITIVPLPGWRDPTPAPTRPARIGAYSRLALDLAATNALTVEALAGLLPCDEAVKVARTTIARLRARCLVNETGALTRLGRAALTAARSDP